jgi:hypothetical protein
MTFPSFPGQGNQGPVAPIPAAGGFAPVTPQAAVQAAHAVAQQAFAPPRGFAPQPGGGFTGQPVQAQAQAPVYQQPAAPQGYAPQATRPMVSEAEIAALRAAQMGKGKRERLPVGNYVCVGETSEFFDANSGKGGGRPNRALALLLTVEQSDVPTVAPGHRAKTSEFLDTEYDVGKQLETFKKFCGQLYGVQTPEQMDTFDWLTPVTQQTSEVFKGAKYQIAVRPVLDRAGRVKVDKRGQTVTRDSIQRIG